MRKFLLWCGAVFALALSHGAQAQNCTVSTFPYLEDFDGPTWGVSTTFDSCWVRVSTSDPDWNVDNNGTPSSSTGPAVDLTGGNYLFLETSGGSLGALGYAQMPAFDLSGLTNPTLGFAYHKYGATMGDLIFEASTDSGATWCEVYRLAGQTQFSDTDPWLVDSVDLSLVASSYTMLRVAGTKGSSFTGDMAIDSVTVYDGAGFTGCAAPVCFDMDASNPFAPDFTWLSNGTQFQFEYGLGGYTPGTGTNTSVTTTGITISSGLAGQTTYDFYVLNDCGTDSSAWVGPISYTTPCLPVNTFPYVEDFDGPTWGLTTTFDQCWTRVTTATPSWFLDNNTTGSSGTGPTADVTGGNYVYLETSGGSLGSQGIMESPEFDLTGLTNPRMQFYYHKYGATMGDFVIEASVGGANWCEVKRVAGQTHFSSTDPWILDSLDLGLLASANTKFRFVGVRGSSFTGDMAFDSIAIYDAPVPPGGVCVAPACASVDAVTASTADISWLSNGTAFDVEYGVPGFTPGIGSGTTASVSTTNATLTGLTSNTQYEVYVRTDCGSGSLSSWTGPLSFLTPCTEISSFPWTETFDSAVWGANFNYDACWTANPTGGFYYSWWVGNGPRFNTRPNSDVSGSGNFIYAYAAYTSTQPVYMQTPDLNMTSLTDPELKFFYHMYGSNMGALYVEVSVDTGQTWTAIDSIIGQQQTAPTDAWEARTVELDNYSTALTQVRFRAMRGNGSYGDIAVDEVTVRNTPPCPDPSNFQSFNVGSTTADVSFTAAAGSSRIVEWGPAGFSPGTGQTTTSTSDTINLTGLPPGTCIDVYVQADCSSSGNGISISAGPYTICTAYVPDWLEDYDAGYPPFDFAEATGLVGSNLSYGSSNWTQDNYANSGSVCAKFNIYSSFQPHHWMISPRIDLGTGNTYNLEYDVAWTEWSQTSDAIVGTDDTVHVVLSTDGGQTFPRSNIITSYHTGNVVDAAGRHEVFQLSGYNGIVQIGFYTTSTVSNEDTDFFIDNLEVRTPPACQEPFAFNPIFVGEDSVYFDFIADSSATQYFVEWGPCGYAQGTGTTDTISNDTAGIGGLMPATCYEFYLMTDCGLSTSIWAGPFTVTTSCPAFFSAPYSTDFTMTSYGTADANNEWENCWSTNPSGFSLRWESEDASGANENSFNTGPHYDNTTPSTPGGGYMFLETSSSGTDRWLLSPNIEMSGLTTPTMSFAYHMYGATMDDLHVDVWNGSMWVDDVFMVSGQQQSLGSDPWTMVDVPLAAFVGDTIQVRFRGERGTSFTGDMAIDDFSIGNGPNCSVVSGGFAENITSSSGDLNWSAFSSSNYNIEWGPCGFTPGTGVGTVVNNVQPGHTLTGLNPNTCYEFYVTNNCDPNGTQYGPFSFLTACSAQLSGTYTIGGTPGPTNFATIDSAIAELICGISGPVTFNIMGNDTASAPLLIGAVQGVSSTNTITFDGMGSATIFKGPYQGPIWDLQDAKHITLRNMTMSDSSFTDAIGVRLFGNTDSVTIEGNTIIAGPSATSSTTAGIAITGSLTSVSATGADVNYAVIRNNTIIGGYYGITGYGGSNTSTKIDGITIEGNTLSDQYYYGIRVYYYNDVLIKGNTVNDARNTFTYGAYLYYNDNMDVIENVILGKVYGMYAPGMNFSDPNGVANIVNNMIINTHPSTTTYAAVYVTGNSHDVNVYHNSIVGHVNYGWRDFNTNGYDMRNNIIVGGNLAMDMSAAPDTNDTFDYNLLYNSNGGTLVEWPGAYADLAALQTGIPGSNQNSVSGDPIFVGPTDLHLTGALANDAGDNSVGITTDIDGDTRPQAPSTTVDIGADEYTPLQWDAEAVMIYEPSSGGCGDSAVAVSMIVRNLGLNTITTMTANANVTGTVTANLSVNYNGSIPSTGEDTISLGTFNIYNGGSVSIIGDVVLAMDGDNTNDTTASVSFDYLSFEPMAMPADTVCEGDPISLYAVPQVGVVHGWYANMTDTVAVATGDTLTVNADPAQTTYYLAYETSGLDSIETTFAAGNGCGGGNMIDLTLNKPIILEELALLSSQAAGTNTSVTLHWKTGSYAGSETTPAAWTTHGTYSFTSNGSTTPSHATLSTPLVLPAGNVALYIEYDARYTTGANSYSNADMTISAGIGLCSSFGGTNNPRTFNGRLKYRGSNSCSQDRIAVTYGITPLPVASFTASGSTDGSGSATFDATATTDADSLYWSFGDPAMSSANGTNPTFTYADNDSYTVMMIAYNSCGADTAYDTVVIAGINLIEIAGVNDVRLFPNPSSGNIQLSLELTAPQEMMLEVVNLQGQVLYTEQLGRIEGEYIWSADLSELPKGPYFVRLTGDKGVQTLPLTLH